MISFAQHDDIGQIMEFIDKEWMKGHILARDRSIFEYMYVPDGKVNFVVSTDGDCIDGILGFIPYDRECAQVALTVWKAIKSSNGMVGMSMLNFIEKELNPKVIASPGVNPVTTTAIYKYFKHDVNRMGHYYRLAEKNEYNIANVVSRERLPIPKSDASVSQIETMEQFKAAHIRLDSKAIQKDDWYIERRYFCHPVFKYLFYLVQSPEQDSLVIIARSQEAEGSKCLRIVDLLGNYALLQGFSARIDSILQEGGFEYIDCYVSGVDVSLFLDNGWSDVDMTEDVIPNYFAPFERRNIEIYSSSKPSGRVILRGDGDQDRPN